MRTALQPLVREGQVRTALQPLVREGQVRTVEVQPLGGGGREGRGGGEK